MKKYAEELGVHDNEVFERCRRELQLIRAPQKKDCYSGNRGGEKIITPDMKVMLLFFKKDKNSLIFWNL